MRLYAVKIKNVEAIDACPCNVVLRILISEIKIDQEVVSETKAPTI